VLYNLHRITACKECGGWFAPEKLRLTKENADTALCFGGRFHDFEETVVVVESFWGVLACIRAGIMNVVAIMSNYATDAQVKQLAGFERVIVLFDGDEPGRKGAADLKARLSHAEVKTLAEGVQPDSVSINTLRIFLGFPQEPDGPLTITDEALSLLEAVPA
jgi:hypothetical protein